KTEGPQVAACARFLKIPIHYVWPKTAELIAGIDETLAVQDAPFSSLSIVAQYLLYKQVRARGIKVLLGGQGGDEALMGYRKFFLFWFRQLVAEKRYAATAKYLLQLLPAMGAELRSLPSYWKHRHRFMQGKGLQHILHLPEVALSQTVFCRDKMSSRQIQDVTQTSLPTLLRYEDRNAMGNSVESRLPFLDHQLLELGIALPAVFKLRRGYGKWPLREIMNNKLPSEIRLARYKRGFDLPLGSLLKAGLGESLRQELQEGYSRIREFLTSAEPISELFSDQHLLKRQSAIAEALSLLWLKKVVA
ncbi:MAG TPA: asparagine synthase C-terminal domain-containing protein, partial [Gammaproteobacteria bacterium]|nr:asparagine synthase C-terminal domain-containing protein [Gammaproteobacteria bacterium]